MKIVISDNVLDAMCSEEVLHNVTMVTATPLEGATLAFVCTFRYVFSQVQVRLRSFVWYLNGHRLSPVASGRIQIDVVEPDVTGTWVSMLTFDPATPKDSGSYARSLYCTILTTQYRFR